MMQKLPLGIQTFSEIINSNYLYIDKTKEVYNLITSGKVYFLSRPRRFGKSLLISTLEEIFSGNKDLFKGLYIKEKSDWKWEKHPVIKLSFTEVEIINDDDYRNYISSKTDDYAKKYNIKLEKKTFNLRFVELVQNLSEKYNKVVFLVDEYDKPILKHITDKNKLKEIKSIMNDFYGAVKDLDQYLKFIFVTGVSKFSKVSVFSGMNNLTDISMKERYSTLVGITQDELEYYFKEGIDQFAKKNDMTKKELLEKIKYWYNGYHFSENSKGIYNPYSLLNFFSDGKFENYWFTSATPTFLIDMIKKNKYELTKLENLRVAPSAFNAIDPEKIGVQTLFLQTGYLTIKDYDGRIYTIDFPNYEVKNSFLESIVEQFSTLEPGDTPVKIFELKNCLVDNKLDEVMEFMKVFFADIPNTVILDYEKYYQSLFYAILKLLSFEVDVEISTNVGRIDCIIKTNTHIYIIEFKLNGSAKDALKQIKENNYSQKYSQDKREKVLVGVEFNKKLRNIKEWKRE